jgi:hypothetical protein
MGRKPAWQIERQLTAARAREAYYLSNIPPESGTVEQRDKTTYFYRSLNIKSGTEHTVFKVKVDNASVTGSTGIGSADAAGLLTAAPANTSPLSVVNNVKPSRIYWYAGKATPTVGRTPWNSRRVTYYDSANGRSHFSIPVSEPTGEFDAADLVARFQLLFGPTGTKKGLLGTKNGRAWLEIEQFTTSFGSSV